jgi:hypothetical protein
MYQIGALIWLQILLFICLYSLILTTGIWIRDGAHGGYDRSVRDVHNSAAPDPIFAFVGGPCCPTLHFVFSIRIMIMFYTLLTSLFCIYRNIVELNYICSLQI